MSSHKVNTMKTLLSATLFTLLILTAGIVKGQCCHPDHTTCTTEK